MAGHPSRSDRLWQFAHQLFEEETTSFERQEGAFILTQISIQLSLRNTFKIHSFVTALTARSLADLSLYAGPMREVLLPVSLLVICASMLLL